MRFEEICLKKTTLDYIGYINTNIRCCIRFFWQYSQYGLAVSNFYAKTKPIDGFEKCGLYYCALCVYSIWFKSEWYETVQFLLQYQFTYLNVLIL